MIRLGELEAHPREDADRHRRTERIDDVDLAVRQHVSGDAGALDGPRKALRDVDRDDRLGAVGERRLVRVLEIARRGCGRGRERRIGCGHPLPERGAGHVHPGLE